MTGAEATPAPTTEATPAGEDLEAEAIPAPLSLKPTLEAVLMVADQPLDAVTLAEAVQCPQAEVKLALRELSAEYTADKRGFDLRQVAGGWRFYSRADYASVVERFVVDGQQSRLSQAALETLAVVAYRQPISRARVSAIRGVNVDAVMRTLVTRGLVDDSGIEEQTGAHLFTTTAYFLERMGLTSLDELPDIAPLLPDMRDVEEDLTLGEPPIARASPPTAAGDD